MAEWWQEFVDNIVVLAAVVVGAALSWFFGTVTDRRRAKTERQNKLREAYAEWYAATCAFLNALATDHFETMGVAELGSSHPLELTASELLERRDRVTQKCGELTLSYIRLALLEPKPSRKAAIDKCLSLVRKTEHHWNRSEEQAMELAHHEAAEELETFMTDIAKRLK